MSADSQAQVSTRDDGKHVRTAITIEPGKLASLDILRSDGSLLCRLNIGAFPDRGGTVDVILNPSEQRGTFLAWHNGCPQVREETKQGTTVHAVGIRPA